ncbi:MAG: spermidine/putrescine ABC transporter substrate-binding protein [bacterium]|nr:spermidine/putrescine ABC transporter substrate-binding protein [bacterium]
MQKKWLAVFVAVLVLAFALPVLGQDAPAAEPWVCPEGFEGQTLSIYNFSTYVAEDTVSNFEAACGVTVIYDVYESNEALLARLSQGNPGYDVIHPADFMVSVMIGAGLLQEIDYSLIPNFANVGEAFLNPPYDPENVFSVPYQWGTLAIGYNLTNVGEPITSWDQVFSYDGPIALLDEPRLQMAPVLNYLGFDPNTADEAEIEAARDFLIENGDNVAALAADDGQARLEVGEVDITVEYSGDIFQLIADCECEDFAYVIPEEGAQIWTDNMAIPVGAPNAALAHAYIDYILSPIAGSDISNYTAYGTPLSLDVVGDLIDPELLGNPGIYPPEEVLANLFFVNDVPEAQVLYTDAWDIVKVALSR